MKYFLLAVLAIFQLNFLNAAQQAPGGTAFEEQKKEVKELADPASLMKFIQSNDVKSIKTYLQNGGTPNAFYQDYSLLMWAVLFHRLEIIKELISSDVDTSSRDKLLGQTAIEIAQSLKQPAALSYRRRSNINEAIEQIIELLNIKTNDPRFAYVAIMNQNKDEGLERLKIYLNAGGDPNAQPMGSFENASLIKWSVNTDNTKAIELLQGYGARIDLQQILFNSIDTRDPNFYGPKFNVFNWVMQKYRNQLDINALTDIMLHRREKLSPIALAGFKYNEYTNFLGNPKPKEIIFALLDAGADVRKKGSKNFCELLEIQPSVPLKVKMPTLKQIWAEYRQAKGIVNDPCAAGRVEF